MPKILKDVIRFRGDRLFNGAVNLGWLDSDTEKADKAAEAFVFHGPAYHGVSQEDVGASHGHQLQDTASFSEAVLRRCLGLEDQPFTLAIAGYGTGKSHLGLTLGQLLRNPDSQTALSILEGISKADSKIGERICEMLKVTQQPSLVVAINGMQSFDLTAEVTRQIVAQLKSSGLDTRPLVELRPRFAHAATLIKLAIIDAEVIEQLQETCGTSDINTILSGLEQQDEHIYSSVHQILTSINLNISAIGGESVRDVIDVTVREYCGDEKAFRSLVILFDEFGKYTEFATVKPHVAGSGVLQELFEGIQAHATKACFIGFIQYELNAYVQRVAPQYQNEIKRYVSRYDLANKSYLSINLETLVANLIEKEAHVVDEIFEGDEATHESKEIMQNISRWFPQSSNHSLWSNEEKFQSVIRKGCWPLSAYSTWFLFYLASGGKHLQERSALALLGDLFTRCANLSVPDRSNGLLSPVDFWSDHLQQELISAEESGQQGSITHSYTSIESRHGAQLDDVKRKLLRAVVLASKLGLKASDKDDAIEAISELAGLHLKIADQGIGVLRDELNVLEWDPSFKAFEILGDAVPRTQFLSFIRQRVASSYDEKGMAKLFAGKASNWCDLLKGLDCDFAEENKITTREWQYLAETSNLEILLMQVQQAALRWQSSIGVDEPRGTLIYCYVEQNQDMKSVEKQTAQLLRGTAHSAGVKALPVWVIFLYDEDGNLGQTLAERAVLEEALSAEDRAKFGNLVAAHEEKVIKNIRTQIEAMIKQRIYVSAFKEPLESRRISRVGTEIFGRIYKSPIVFPFDGFTTAKGNAADCCKELTAELIQDHLDWDGVISKPVKVKNRAETVLKDSWGVYATNGRIKSRPSQPIIRSLTEKWDNSLNSGEQRVVLKEAMLQLCAPPYGANVASAGLFLGVFIAARHNKLVLIQNGAPITFTKWVEESLFRGKYIDVNSLHDVELILQGDVSSEWENLLDEWEEADSHLARKECFERSLELTARIPVPSALGYRHIHLQTISQGSISALNDNEVRQNTSFSKIEKGMERKDPSLLSWGVSELTDIIYKMTEEAPLWSDHQVQELQPVVERGRQSIIKYFPDWVTKQVPSDASPGTVGDFKHKMLHLVCRNLKKLNLDDLSDKLDKHTNDVIKQIETVAEGKLLLTEVNLWLDAHADQVDDISISELRSLIDIGKEFSAKLRGLETRIQSSKITLTRSRLSETHKRLKKTEDALVKRHSDLWKRKLTSTEELNATMAEVEALLHSFNGCSKELDPLLIMRRILRLYLKDFQQLNDPLLSWDDFDRLSLQLESEAKSDLGDEDIPWPPEEIINQFADVISKIRKQASTNWIESMEADAASVTTMTAADANRLYERANDPPPLITEAHSKRLSKTQLAIKKRLESLKLDWLIERFSELPSETQKKFLKIASDLTPKS